VIADLDTRSGELYAPVDEVLPAGRLDLGLASGGGAAPRGEGFARSRELFEGVVGWLCGEQAGGLTHGELEERLQVDAREVFRQLYEDHLDLRAEREQRIEEVRDAEGVRHSNVEVSHERPLVTVLGAVGVRRLAYRARGRCNLHPADGALNLPAQTHSHGLRRLCAIESARRLL